MVERTPALVVGLSVGSHRHKPSYGQVLVTDESLTQQELLLLGALKWPVAVRFPHPGPKRAGLKGSFGRSRGTQGCVGSSFWLYLWDKNDVVTVSAK